ncbi:MAG TPA: sugar nucleotide-binding protein [Gemmatimonadaceae bacterium]|nr:sugar nucleotide-binding protein [Gemmatimonadaceae bacterium]
MKIFVLGHRGMLGHVVARLFAQRGCDVETTSARYLGEPRDALIEQVRESRADAVINCLGSTKRRGGDRTELYWANALFPVHLVARLHAHQHLVHASTDCVFGGTRGGYAIDEEPDADDAYGFSKRLGEMIAGRAQVTVLRVSIVGPDRPDGRGLLAWFLRQPTDVEVSGYTNHRWNGITTLEWATLAHDAVVRRQRGEPLPAMMQPGTVPVTKYELLTMFRDVYGTAHRVTPVRTTESVDRTLVPTDLRAPIAVQLIALRDWYAC